MTTFERVQRIVAEQLDKSAEEVTPGAHLTNDLGADSLDYVEIAMRLEEEFSIGVSDENVTSFGTVQQIVEYVEQNMNQPG